MSHDLDPIRALYGEASSTAPGALELDAAGRAERDALTPVRDALGCLPPVSPDAATVAAVLAMARREAEAAPAAASQADLSAIRSLYEGVDIPLAAAARAEASALAPVRDALNRLAPLAPPADTVAAVLAMAHREAASSAAPDPLASDPLASDPLASDPLASVRILYDAALAEALSEEAQAEVQALAPVRDALAALTPVSPDAATVAAVLAMARPEPVPVAPAPRRPAADRSAARPPANPSRRRFRIGLPVLGVLVAGIALVVALGPGSGSVAEQQAAVGTDQAESFDALREAAPAEAASGGAASEDAAFAAASAAPPPASTVAGADLAEDPAAWDVTNDLPTLALRVQALQAAGELEWEEPPVALGSGVALDAAPAPAAGWMQVRMDGSGR